jgi:hypothetical protein
MPSGLASRMTAQRSSDGQLLPPLEDNPARPCHLLTEQVAGPTATSPENLNVTPHSVNGACVYSARHCKPRHTTRSGIRFPAYFPRFYGSHNSALGA